jgi:hypothetical protein
MGVMICREEDLALGDLALFISMAIVIDCRQEKELSAAKYLSYSMEPRLVCAVSFFI